MCTHLSIAKSWARDLNTPGIDRMTVLKQDHREIRVWRHGLGFTFPVQEPKEGL